MPRRYLEQRLRLSQLRVIDALEIHRSLLKAAASLGLTQPSLTKSLHEIEDTLQARLFNRHSRGVTPTDVGVVVVRAVRRILAEVRRLDEELDQLATPDGGSLAVGALPVAAAGVLPGALARLKASHPRITVRVQQGRTEDLLPQLASGELDLIVGQLYPPVLPDGFVREPLWTEPISILARIDHPVFSRPVTVDELREYELVLPTVNQRVGQEIEHLLSLLGLAPRTAMRSSSYGFIREMLHATNLIAMLPRLLMVGDLLRGTLKVVPLPIAAPDRPAGIILRHDGAMHPAGLAFAAALRAYVGEISERGIANIAAGNSSEAISNTT